LKRVKEEAIRPRQSNDRKQTKQLETVLETDEADDDENDHAAGSEETANVALDAEMKNAKSKSGLSISETADTSEARSTDGGITELSSLSSISTDGSKRNRPFCHARAKIAGRQISKFTPPRLPEIDKKPTAYFSFLTASPGKKGLPPPTFHEGDKCSTPYGAATVTEYRASEKIVVVEFSKWQARGYLNETDVKVTKDSILSSLSLFRRQGSATDFVSKQLEFPYAMGTLINTPYGEAEVYKPLPLPKRTSKQLDETEILNKIIGLRLVSWQLANNSYPTLYCTVKTAREWKDSKSAKTSSDGLLSTFGTLLKRPFTSRFTTPAKETTSDETEDIPKFRQYYNDATKVSTAYGNGEISLFREEDGFYKVLITSWILANGKCATAWLREVDIRCRIADDCQEGYPVLTRMGLTGILESVQPSTGVHLVTVPSVGMAMYLQADAIAKPLKGAVGEDALTAYGEGTIEKYDATRDMYVIRLKGWGARLYCKAEKFDRVRDSSRDRDAMSSMGWIFNYFFSSRPENLGGEVGTRTRSNSVTSASHSVRSVS